MTDAERIEDLRAGNRLIRVGVPDVVFDEDIEWLCDEVERLQAEASKRMIPHDGTVS